MAFQSEYNGLQTGYTEGFDGPWAIVKPIFAAL